MFHRSLVTALSKRFSLRTAIAIPFALQLVAFTGLVGYLSYQQGQQAILDLGTQLQDQVSRRIVQHLEDYLETPNQLTALNAAAIEAGTLDPTNLADTAEYFWQQMQVFEVSDLNFTSSDGEFVGIYRRNDGRLVLTERNFDRDPTRAYEYQLNRFGDRVTVLDITDDYDPRRDRGYLQAVEAGEFVWTQGSVRSPGQNTPAVSASYPLYDEDGDLLGVLGVDLRLSRIAQFLRTLKIGRAGQAFAIDRQGVLVATSGTDAFLGSDDRPLGGIRATESRDRTVQAAATHLIRHFDNLNQIEETQILRYQLQNHQYFLQVSPFRDPSGLDWLVVVTVPQADFTSAVRRTARVTLLLCVFGLAVATFVGWQVSQGIVRPLQRLTEGLRKLGSQWKTLSFLDVRSGGLLLRTREIKTLLTTFNRTAAQLQTTLAELESENKALRETDRLKDLYLFNLAEEFQPTIQKAIDNAKALLDRRDRYPPEDLQRFDRVVRAGTRLLELMQEISDLTKIHSGQLRPNLEAVDIQVCLDSIITQHRSDLDEKSLQLSRHDFPPPLYVRADRRMLEQVLSIVLENAIQFTESGEIVVRTAITAPMGKTSYHELPEAIISISDTGIGIAPDQQEKLFQPFAKLEGCPEHCRGPGLGLAVAKSLVELMRGQIAVESEGIDRGTTVIIVLPIGASI
ncbi:sensor histidine kinase [Baaleninema simplex]|uniref:sensor histidine kinase n=1 Tax=Baaleninema simplex TaxID=2862350 RepID=UPI00034A294D|nr:ATP-binding protein [Baaleninema simplex]